MIRVCNMCVDIFGVRGGNGRRTQPTACPWLSLLTIFIGCIQYVNDFAVYGFGFLIGHVATNYSSRGAGSYYTF